MGKAFAMDRAFVRCVSMLNVKTRLARLRQQNAELAAYADKVAAYVQQ